MKRSKWFTIQNKDVLTLHCKFNIIASTMLNTGIKLG